MMPDRRPFASPRRDRSRLLHGSGDRRRLAFERMEPRRMLAGVDDPWTEGYVECLATPTDDLTNSLPESLFDATSDARLESAEGVRVLSCADGQVWFEFSLAAGNGQSERWAEYIVIYGDPHSVNWNENVVEDLFEISAGRDPSRETNASTVVPVAPPVEKDGKPAAAVVPRATQATDDGRFTPLPSEGVPPSSMPFAGPASSSVVSTPPTDRYFESAPTPRRLNWSLRDESPTAHDDALTRMSVWSGRTEDAVSSLAATRFADRDAGLPLTAAESGKHDSSSASIAVWREAARRQPPATQVAGSAAESGEAWSVAAGAAGQPAGLRPGQPEQAKWLGVKLAAEKATVEKVTLEAAVGSSLATVEWAKRWVAGESSGRASSRATASWPTTVKQDDGESLPADGQTWATYAAAIFSLVQLWRRQRRAATDEPAGVVEPATSGDSCRRDHSDRRRGAPQ